MYTKEKEQPNIGILRGEILHAAAWIYLTNVFYSQKVESDEVRFIRLSLISPVKSKKLKLQSCLLSIHKKVLYSWLFSNLAGSSQPIVQLMSQCHFSIFIFPLVLKVPRTTGRARLTSLQLYQPVIFLPAHLYGRLLLHPAATSCKSSLYLWNLCFACSKKGRKLKSCLIKDTRTYAYIRDFLVLL